MTKDVLVKVRDAIDVAGIDKYQIQLNNSYYINVGYEGDCLVEFDDDNEIIYYFRSNNTVTSRGAKPMSFEVETYETVERFIVPVVYTEGVELASQLGLTLTEEVTDWVKEKSSIAGLHPIQSTPRYDEDGNPVIYNGMPTIH